MRTFLLLVLMVVTFSEACKKADNATSASPASPLQVDSVSKVMAATSPVATYLGTLWATATYNGGYYTLGYNPGPDSVTITSFAYSVTTNTSGDSVIFFMTNGFSLPNFEGSESFNGTFKINIQNSFENNSSSFKIINDSLYVSGSFYYAWPDYTGYGSLSFSGKLALLDTATLSGQRRK